MQRGSYVDLVLSNYLASAKQSMEYASVRYVDMYGLKGTPYHLNVVGYDFYHKIMDKDQEQGDTSFQVMKYFTLQNLNQCSTQTIRHLRDYCIEHTGKKKDMRLISSIENKLQVIIRVSSITGIGSLQIGTAQTSAVRIMVKRKRLGSSTSRSVHMKFGKQQRKET